MSLIDTVVPARSAGRLERRLNRQDIRSIALLILGIYAVVVAVSFSTQRGGKTVFGPQLGADFGAFYTAGRIYREVAPGRIYDRAEQRRIYREIHPGVEPGQELPYVNAPFFALPLPLLARLPYSAAYLLWFALSLGLFLLGIRLLWDRLDAFPSEDRGLAGLLAVSFMPFMVECLSGGQTSAFGFAALALALALERRGRSVASGMAIALCLYKPTLLVLILPMLLVTRRFRSLLGVAIGALLLSLVSLGMVGVEGCRSYLRMLLFFADNSTSAATGLKSWKYVDINSFSRLLFQAQPSLRWALTGIVFAAALPLLVRAWVRASQRPATQSLVWASAITWTLILNIYLGIYDATLAVIAALLTCDAIYRKSERPADPFSYRCKMILLALYLVPWVTQPVAKLTGLQLLTLAIAVFGAYQLSLLRKSDAAMHAGAATA
ncbi:MAG: glycosyltransferase family 87 protein [Blastocatellia bacterium]|nr:glycosyltransferase family 87 protein [Blastocatellia bacterium]